MPTFLSQITKAFQECDLVDLSHLLEEGIPSYPTQSKFFHMNWPIVNDPSKSFQIIMHEHNGTHIDSPVHFIKEDNPLHIGQISLGQFCGKGHVLDFSQVKSPYLVDSTQIQKWEEKNVCIEPGDVVLFNFGMSKKWGIGASGHEFLREWPGISKDAADYLVEKKVKIVGTDAISIDASHATEFGAHYTLLGNDVLIVECLNNLDTLSGPFFFLAFPLKIKDGTGSPIRAVALLPK